MIKQFVMSFSIVMFLSSTFCEAASAPAPTNTQLLKRIVQLESQLKSVNTFIDAQKRVNKRNFDSIFIHNIDISNIKNDIYNTGNLYDMIKENKRLIDSTNDSLERSDGIICRLKQLEEDVYKFGSQYHSYEPICVTN